MYVIFKDGNQTGWHFSNLRTNLKQYPFAWKYTDSADFVYYQRDNNIGGNLDHVSLKVYCPGYFSYQTYIHKMKI